MKRLVIVNIVIMLLISCTIDYEKFPVTNSSIPTDDVTPYFTPNAGTFTLCPTISILVNGASTTIRFTRDGTDPKTSGTAETYTGPFAFNGTILAYGYDGTDESAVVSATFNVTGEINLPMTGQTATYQIGDDGYYQYGVFWAAASRFTVNGDGTITDNLTGLIWLQDNTGFAATDWNTAVSDCNTNSFSTSYSDWRLPNIIELRSLINYGSSLNFTDYLNTFGFNLSVQALFASTSQTNFTSYTYRAEFTSGALAQTNKTDLHSYLPVRGTSSALRKTGQIVSYATGDDGDYQHGRAYPSPRFVDNGNGTITDNLTGLMWQKVDPNSNVIWTDAVSNAAGITDGGYSDWRLPNVNEILSLMNFRAGDIYTWLNSQGFNGFASAGYWSSTSDSSGSSAWYCSSTNATLLTQNKTNFRRVI